jgi:nucleotide-binding universal stress UspA family protein
MKKILLAFSGRHFSKTAIEFAENLNEKTPILLTGAFLAHVDYANLLSYWGGGSAGPLFVPVVEGEDSDAVQENIRRFETFCIKNGIEYRIHKDFDDFALPELKKETRFADLLLISGESFYKDPGSNEPSEYLKEALHGVECSVVVIPEESVFPGANILAYDGSAQSVFAIKQFAYLFPELTGNETILIYADKKESEELPDEVNIEELAARHYSDLVISRVHANPKDFFHSWLLEKKNSILVSGAFGRSGLSRLFHKSFVSDVIKEHRLPVFISHSL